MSNNVPLLPLTEETIRSDCTLTGYSVITNGMMVIIKHGEESEKNLRTYFQIVHMIHTTHEEVISTHS